MNKRLNLLKLTVIAVVAALIIPMLPVSEAQAATSKSYWDGYSTDYYYKQFNSKEKKLYNALDKECYRILSTKTNLSKYGSSYVTKRVTVSGLSDTQIAKVCELFRRSEPQYYFLDSKYWYGSGGAQLVVYKNYANGSTRAKATKKIKAKLDKWVKAAKAGIDTADKLSLVDTAICDAAVYKENSLDQSMAGIILKGEGVCTSYAMCFEAVANKLGCDCLVTCGNEHAWNKVKVDGTWYLADVCWEDEAYATNYWFLISDSTAKSRDGYSITHENNENPKGIKVPSAKSDYEWSSIDSGNNSGYDDGWNNDDWYNDDWYNDDNSNDYNWNYGNDDDWLYWLDWINSYM